MFWFLFILTLSTFDKDLEEPEPTLEEYDGFLSVPYGASEKSVGTPTPEAVTPTAFSVNVGFKMLLGNISSLQEIKIATLSKAFASTAD